MRKTRWTFGAPVPNSPHGLCERKSAFEEAEGKGRIVVVFS